MALCTLIRGNELELASCVGIVLGEAARQTTAYCLELLARKYMTTHTWYVWLQLSPLHWPGLAFAPYVLTKNVVYLL